MRLPALSELATSRTMIDVFGGYNHNLRIGENEFYDMKNLSSSHYPLLAPRQHRGVYKELVDVDGNPTYTPTGIIEKDALCYAYQYATNLYFVMNEQTYDLGMAITQDANGNTVDETTERTLVSMGAYVIIMPDKMYINTEKPSDKGMIEASYTSPAVSGSITHSVEYCVCKMDGTEYEIDVTKDSKPDAAKDFEGATDIPNGGVWLDTSSSPCSLKIYSETSGTWTSVTTTYIKIKAEGIGSAFKEYDGVRIEGVNDDIAENDLNTSMIIYSIPDANSIVVVGMLKNGCEASQRDVITVSRTMPHMDFIIESKNRLWGCRYGLNRDGEVVNEIYCSKLGDFKNWECFMGVATDSYYVAVGTDGRFTGAISYLGYPLFFKENCLHMVYGSFPAEFQVQDTACRGVQKGSHKSLAMVNETLFYKSRTGICAYSGALPVEISSALGETAYYDAVACAYKGKYYISMCDASSTKYALFVYDSEKGMWHKEDDLKVMAFCPRKDEIYYINGKDNKIRTLFGGGTKDTKPVEWMAETGILGCSSPDKKYISRLAVRLSLDIGARVVFSIQYDSSGDWERVCVLTGHSIRTMTLPIRPKRCDHFRLKIEGEGNAKIFSITKVTEQGSDT